MTANTSSAVMQQRREAHDSLDDFPTPPWATRALIERLIADLEEVPALRSAREPAANRGHMVRPLREAFGAVDAADVHDYGAGFRVEDYLFAPCPPVDWTIMNPPFRLAEQFIEKALRESREGVAVFVRSAFAEGVGRHERLFSRNPPSRIYQFAERVVLHKGRLAPEGSTATAYCWIVWAQGEADTRFRWIRPCRARLERPEDYA